MMIARVQTRLFAMLVAMLALSSGAWAQAFLPSEGAGQPGDLYYIPPGYFDDGVPSLGTPQQQAMMALAVTEMEGLAESQRVIVEMTGLEAVQVVSDAIENGASTVYVFQLVITYEDLLLQRARAGQELIASSILPIFGPIESSVPRPPAGLISSAFGPVIVGISRLYEERSIWLDALRELSPAPLNIDLAAAPGAPTLGEGDAGLANLNRSATGYPPGVVGSRAIRQYERDQKRHEKKLARERKKSQKKLQREIKKLEREQRRAARQAERAARRAERTLRRAGLG